MTDRHLRIERTFDAPAAAVFDAWTSEEVLRRWLHAGPDWDTPTAEVHLRVGGSLRIVMHNPATGYGRGAHGEYTVVEPPHRLAFTWIWDDDTSNPQLIELEFSEDEGKTTVVMINSGLPSEDVRRNQANGWALCYDNLDEVIDAS